MSQYQDSREMHKCANTEKWKLSEFGYAKQNKMQHFYQSFDWGKKKFK